MYVGKRLAGSQMRLTPLLAYQKHRQHCRRWCHAAAYGRRHNGTPGEGAESTDAMVLLCLMLGEDSINPGYLV